MLPLSCQRHFTLCISWLFYRKEKKIFFKENVRREGARGISEAMVFHKETVKTNGIR